MTSRDAERSGAGFGPDGHRLVAAEMKRRLKPVERAEIVARESRPVLAELAKVGLAFDGIYDIGAVVGGVLREPTAEQLAVVMDHLERGGYSVPTVHGRAKALADSAALGLWHRMKALYLSTDDAHLRDRLAASMSRIALKRHVDDLFEFVGREALGGTRTYFLSKVYRWGGERGKELVASLREHPDLGVQATDIVHRNQVRAARAARKRQAKP